MVGVFLSSPRRWDPRRSSSRCSTRETTFSDGTRYCFYRHYYLSPLLRCVSEVPSPTLSRDPELGCPLRRTYGTQRVSERSLSAAAHARARAIHHREDRVVLPRRGRCCAVSLRQRHDPRGSPGDRKRANLLRRNGLACWHGGCISARRRRSALRPGAPLRAPRDGDQGGDHARQTSVSDAWLRVPTRERRPEGTPRMVVGYPTGSYRGAVATLPSDPGRR